MIEGAAVHFECQVERRVTIGDHSVFFARIIAAWVPEAPVQKIDNFGSQRYAPAEPAGRWHCNGCAGRCSTVLPGPLVFRMSVAGESCVLPSGAMAALCAAMVVAVRSPAFRPRRVFAAGCGG